MLSVYASLLREANVHLSRALEALEKVPKEAFAREEDLFRVMELIARAGGIVASELDKRSREGFTLGPCTMPDYSRRSRAEE